MKSVHAGSDEWHEEVDDDEFEAGFEDDVPSGASTTARPRRPSPMQVTP